MKEFAHPVIRTASTVNYHLLEACNMSCGFCFATFSDIPKEYGLKRDGALAVVDAETQRKVGRIEKGKGKEPIGAERYLELSGMIRERGIRLKVNTVVNTYNPRRRLAPVHPSDAAGAVEDFPSASRVWTERRAHRGDDRIG